MGQLSPDGHWRWDGWRWVPARPLAPPVQQPSSAPRVPTVWTRRLQVLLLVVAGWGLLSGLISAAMFPGEWGRLQSAIVAEWHAEGIPGSEIATFQRYLASALVVVIVFLVAWSAGVCALQVVGTLRRWVWWYWVQLALCCLAALSLLLTLFDLIRLLSATGAGSPTLTMYRAELGTIPLTLVGDLLCVGAAVCMLIAAIQIGPWAMTRDPGHLHVR